MNVILSKKNAHYYWNKNENLKNKFLFGVLFMSFFLFSIYKTARYEKNKLD